MKERVSGLRSTLKNEKRREEKKLRDVRRMTADAAKKSQNINYYEGMNPSMMAMMSN